VLRRRLAVLLAAVMMMALSATPAFAHHGKSGNHNGVTQGQGFHGNHNGAGKHSGAPCESC
jgi:hypothetical protein